MYTHTHKNLSIFKTLLLLFLQDFVGFSLLHINSEVIQCLVGFCVCSSFPAHTGAHVFVDTVSPSNGLLHALFSGIMKVNFDRLTVSDMKYLIMNKTICYEQNCQFVMNKIVLF